MSPEGQCSLIVSVPYLLRLKFHSVHKYVDRREGCMVRLSCTMSPQNVIILLYLELFFRWCGMYWKLYGPYADRCLSGFMRREPFNFSYLFFVL